MTKLTRWDYWTDIDGTEQWGSDIQGRWCKAEDVERLESINAELLEALEHIDEYWNRDQNVKAMSNALWSIIDIARAAIAKAKGTNV